MTIESALTQRPMTADERAQVEMLLRDAPALWKVGLGNAVVLWAVSMLAVVLAWGAIGWIARPALGIQIGWKSSVSWWLLPVAGIGCAVFAIYSTVQWLRSSQGSRLRIREDLEAGKVAEERLTFVEAKVFQEAEHDGLIYFLRTTDDRVFVLFDSESQDLAIQEKDPFSSSLRPKSELLLVRAPSARFIISRTFAGDDLPTAPVSEMVAPPKEWPESEEFCSVAWNELDSRYGPQK